MLKEHLKNLFKHCDQLSNVHHIFLCPVLHPLLTSNMKYLAPCCWPSQTDVTPPAHSKSIDIPVRVGSKKTQVHRPLWNRDLSSPRSIKIQPTLHVSKVKRVQKSPFGACSFASSTTMLHCWGLHASPAAVPSPSVSKNCVWLWWPHFLFPGTLTDHVAFSRGAPHCPVVVL